MITTSVAYAVIFEKSQDGYGAYVPDLPGCVTVGDTLVDTNLNIREAMTGHIAMMKEHGEIVPQPTTRTEYVLVGV